MSVLFDTIPISTSNNNYPSPVFFGFGEGAEASMERHRTIVLEAVASLGIKPKTMEERDPRPKWSTSVNEAIWLGSGTTPAERNSKFLTILSATQGRYPHEGTSIVAAFPNPDNPLFTRIIIKVSPAIENVIMNPKGYHARWDLVHSKA